MKHYTQYKKFYPDKGFNLMHHHWLVGELYKWLWPTECKWPQASPISADQYQSLHFLTIYNMCMRNILRIQSI